jgi:hypothetical protein
MKAQRLYSVWNPGVHAYDYYQGMGAALRDGVFAEPATRRQGSAIGLTPDEAADRLPSGAKKVGSGDVAKGTIASLGAAPENSTTALLLLGVAALILWKVAK